MTTLAPRKPTTVPNEATARQRHLTEPLPAHAITTAVNRAQAVLTDAAVRAPAPDALDSRRVRTFDSHLADALAALDELDATLRPALEEVRRRAAVLVDELEAEERRRAEEAEAERARARFEAAVAREVDQVEADRLAAIERDARKRLARTSA